MDYLRFGKPKLMLFLPLLALLFAVACGAAATPTPTSAPKAVAQPAAPAAPVVAPAPAPIPASAPAVHPGKLTWMISGAGNERFDMMYAVSDANNYLRIVQGFPITLNEKTELLPGIATKWQLSKDGKTWTFTIRDGAKFHDGKSITAEDVWWSWMHYWGKDESGSALERATDGPTQDIARIVDRIETTTYGQLSIATKVVFPGFATTVISEAGSKAYGVLPKRPKVFDDAQEAAYEKNPIGAGPMKLVRHVTADLMAFERFDDFYYQPKNGLPEDRRVRFTSLDLRFVPEEATRVAAIRAGEADIAPVSLAAKKQVEAGGGRLVFGREGVVVDVQPIGCEKPQFPCHDKRVRQALAYAIDKEQMRDKLFGGPEVFQVKGWSVVTPSTIGYSPDVDPFPFDPAKARQLLAEAGYPGGKGFGKLVVWTFPSAAMPFQVEGAQLAANFWKRELGLDVEVTVSDAVTVKKRDVGGGLDGQMRWNDNEARVDAAENIRKGYGTTGRTVHDSPELLALTQKAIGVIDPAESTVALTNLYRRLRDEQYKIGIGYVNIPWAVGPRILTWQPWPLALYPSALHTITIK